jgi:hypothetical protein
MSTPTPSSRPFHWRAFASLVITVAFLVIALTGIGLYVSPPGRIANWSGWTLMGLTKANWQSVHMVFGFVFIAMAAWHLFFNWRALMTYLRSRMHAGFSRPRELAAAMAGSLALVVLTLANVTPVSLVAEYREELAESWATNDSEPPVPHIELKTVAEAAKIAEAPAEQALARLRAAGYDATPERSLADLAAQKQATPKQVYALIRMSNETASKDVAMALASGGGLGRKTLATVAQEFGIPVEKAVSALQAKGITATPDQLLREIASSNGTHAPALVEHLSAIR